MLLLLHSLSLISLVLAKSITNLTEKTSAASLWETYHEKGIRYYEKLFDTSAQDRPFPWQISKTMTIKTNTTYEGLGNQERFALRQNDVTFRRGEWIRITAGWPRNRTVVSWKTEFHFYASPNQGVLAMSLALVDDHEEREDFPYHLSQVEWWMWKKAVRKQNLSPWRGSIWKVDCSNIKQFWAFDIRNGVTVELIQAALAQKNKTQGDETFEPDNWELSNAFWPLLGSPLGSSVVHMLAENKNAVKRKVITSISVRGYHIPDMERDEEGGQKETGYTGYLAWATIEPVT